jgi:hypothetical protein
LRTGNAGKQPVACCHLAFVNLVRAGFDIDREEVARIVHFQVRANFLLEDRFAAFSEFLFALARSGFGHVLSSFLNRGRCIAFPHLIVIIIPASHGPTPAHAFGVAAIQIRG